MYRPLILQLAAVLALFAAGTNLSGAEWTAKKAPLMTRWAKEVSPDNVHSLYPRPQMVRKEWQNLNGLWEYAIRPRQTEDAIPESWEGSILVPFPVESALSGVMRTVGPEKELWYRRKFAVPAAWRSEGKRVLIHFGGSDWETTVWVNGKALGIHRGGYDPFSFDVTDALKDGKDQAIVVKVWDPSDASFQPRGKQVRKPESIWYTPTTGIWQTVWLEPAPPTSISGLRLVPDIDAEQLRFEVLTRGAPGGVTVRAKADLPGGESKTFATLGQTLALSVPRPKLWSPDSPYLYDLTVQLEKDGKIIDEVQSYFAMRKIGLGKDEKGINRLLLNGKFVFQYGPLDQGFWPDGLYTAPTDEALRYDLEVTKRLGFNMVRKHVKVEPARWYYHCDKLGLMVWQDMPSGDKYIGPNDADAQRSAESVRNFEQEWKAILAANHNSPCIVMWVPFNEGWGQFDTARIVDFTRSQDPTRLVNSASGWTDREVGDVHDIHVYPGPDSPRPTDRRAAVLGEFGGLGLPVEGHTWQEKGNWGYVRYSDSATLTKEYVNLLDQLHPLIGSPGLSAAVYTQTTDVEIEVNGLMTYDRAVLKMDEQAIAAANRQLYGPPPVRKTVLPLSREKPAEWRYTIEAPAKNWFAKDFDDSQWQRGAGGFGTRETPNSQVGTEWKSKDLWVRRTFELPADSLSAPRLLLHHDEDAEVYINGVLAAAVKGYSTRPMLVTISEAASKSLQPGTNSIAIHCRQTTGGQYLDAGLIDIVSTTSP